MTNPHVYSPLDPAAYQLAGQRDCEVRWVLSQDIANPLWNLFYLSVPDIDTVPGAGLDWYRTYTPAAGLLGALVHDIQEDEVLYRKLLMRRNRFLEWFERTDHGSKMTYQKFGGQSWAATVINRASHENVRTKVGNVVYASFGKLAAA